MEKQDSGRRFNYFIMVIILFGALLTGFKLFSIKNARSEKTERAERAVSAISINSEIFEESLCDSCRMQSGNKLKCSPALLRKIVANVDSAAFQSISEGSVTFKKDEGDKHYIEVPAGVIANMKEQNLFITSNDE